MQVEPSKITPNHPRYHVVLSIAKERMSRSNPFAAKMIEDGQISDTTVLKNLAHHFHDNILLDMLIDAYEKLGVSPYAVNSKTVNAGE